MLKKVLHKNFHGKLNEDEFEENDLVERINAKTRVRITDNDQQFDTLL